jgi:hypothetical protein
MSPIPRNPRILLSLLSPPILLSPPCPRIHLILRICPSRPFLLIQQMFRFHRIPLILWRQWIRRTQSRTLWVPETPLATGSQWATGTMRGSTTVPGAAT